MNSLYCLHPVVLYDELFNGCDVFLLEKQYFSVFYIYVIIITINDFIVKRVLPV